MPHVARMFAALTLLRAFTLNAAEDEYSPERLFVLANENYRKAFNVASDDARRQLLTSAVSDYRSLARRQPSPAVFHNPPPFDYYSPLFHKTDCGPSWPGRPYEVKTVKTEPAVHGTVLLLFIGRSQLLRKTHDCM